MKKQGILWDLKLQLIFSWMYKIKIALIHFYVVQFFKKAFHDVALILLKFLNNPKKYYRKRPIEGYRFT